MSNGKDKLPLGVNEYVCVCMVPCDKVASHPKCLLSSPVQVGSESDQDNTVSECLIK